MTDHNETLAVTVRQPVSPFSSMEAFQAAEQMGLMLCRSKLIPKNYQGDANVGDCLIALEISQRIGCSVLMVMQNLHVIQGRPSWSAPFLIAAIESCGKFSPLRYEEEDLGPKTVEYSYWTGYGNDRAKKTASVKIQDRSCVAYATELATGKVLRSTRITIEMAVREGWYARSDSKWPTMSEQMARYRAASFFNRAYCPGLTMGLHTREEVEDMGPAIDVPIVETTTIGDGIEVPVRASTAEPAKRPVGRPRKTIPQTTPEPPATQEPPPPPPPPPPAQTTNNLSPMQKALETRLRESGITLAELAGALNELMGGAERAWKTPADVPEPDIPGVMKHFQGLADAITSAREGV